MLTGREFSYLLHTYQNTALLSLSQSHLKRKGTAFSRKLVGTRGASMAPEFSAWPVPAPSLSREPRMRCLPWCCGCGGSERRSSAALAAFRLLPARFHPTLSCGTFLFPQGPQSSRLRLSAVCCRVPSRSPTGHILPWVPAAPLSLDHVLSLLSETPQTCDRQGPQWRSSFPGLRGGRAWLPWRPSSLLSHGGRNWQMCGLLLGHQESESQSEAQVCSSGLTRLCQSSLFCLKNLYLVSLCVLWNYK